MNATALQRNSAETAQAANDALLHANIGLNPNGGKVRLERDQHLRLRDALGWKIQAVNGTIWITQEGDSRDIVLKNGQSFVLDRSGTALLSALDQAEICVERAAQAAPAARAARKTAPAVHWQHDVVPA